MPPPRPDRLTIGTTDIEVSIDPSHGGEIIFLGRPGGANLLFRAEWESPRPASDAGYGNSTLDFHATYRGGWQELLPNPGAACEVLGVPQHFHGDASICPWTVVAAEATEVHLRTGMRLPLVAERVMRVEGPTVRIEGKLSNVGMSDVPYGWGHHPAFEAVEGARIDLPACDFIAAEGFDTEFGDLRPGHRSRWPYAEGKTGDKIDLSFVPAARVERFGCCHKVDGWAALRRPDGLGLALAFDSETFPYVWFWQQIGGDGFPWFGRARISALEPVGLWPPDGLAAAIERDEAPILPAGEAAETWITATIFDADPVKPVTGVARDGRVSL